MLGDKKLEMPKSLKECASMINEFGFYTLRDDEPIFCNAYDIMNYAKNLVELNNEVYERLEKEEKKIQSLFESINRLENELDQGRNCQQRQMGYDGIYG